MLTLLDNFADVTHKRMTNAAMRMMVVISIPSYKRVDQTNPSLQRIHPPTHYMNDKKDM